MGQQGGEFDPPHGGVSPLTTLWHQPTANHIPITFSTLRGHPQL